MRGGVCLQVVQAGWGYLEEAELVASVVPGLSDRRSEVPVTENRSKRQLLQRKARLKVKKSSAGL